MHAYSTTVNRNQAAESACEMIRWALRRAQRPLTTTKFGPQSAVLLHMVTEEIPDIPVVWIDTGYNTLATRRFADRLSDQLRLNLHVYRPLDDAWSEIPALDDPAHHQFTYRVKIEPFKRALAELRPDTWFSSIRREQTAHRANQHAVSKPSDAYVKVSPLLEWTSRDMEEYMLDHNLPGESDYYDPTKGEPKRECGLHLCF